MKEMFIESKSKYSFADTMQKLSDLIVSGGWSKISELDLQANIRKTGREVHSVKVVELCKAEYAYRILSDDTQRINSSLLPCRISVYEKADGNCYISHMDATEMAARLGGLTGEVMGTAFKEVEKMIVELVAEG